MTPSERKLRDEIEAWYRERLRRRKSFQLPKLAKEALAHFSGQPQFNRRFVKAMAYPMFYAIAANMVSKLRGHRRYSKHGYIDVEDLEGAVAEAEQQATESIFRDHFENVGDRMVHILKMTKEEDYVAIAHRDGIAQSHTLMANLLRALAARLPKDDSCNGDYWTLEEIEEEYNRLKGTGD